MDDSQTEKFLDELVSSYVALLIQHWGEAKSIDDLLGYHRSVKIEVISRQLRDKWREQTGLNQVPKDLHAKAQQKIENAFDDLKIQFLNKSRESNDFDPGATSTRNTTHSSTTKQPNADQKHKNCSEEKGTSSSEQNDKNNKSDRGEVAIGIDLGTTMCCVAVLYEGNVKIVQNWRQHNSRTTPSYVAFLENGDTFGSVAKDQAYKYPERTVYDAKRMIGRSWKDPNLQRDKTIWPFEVVEEFGNPKVKIGDRTRYPHEVSARLLSQFRAMAEDFLYMKRGTIKKAVITVPAYFSEPQRRATHNAGVCAGLEVLNILSEPTAAAIAYNWDRKLKGSRTALIYDLGGGTFDVAIATVDSGNVDVLCVHGDTHLGGQDFDQLLIEYCIAEFKKETGIDLLEHRNSDAKTERDSARKQLARLRLACERAKEWLAGAQTTTVDLDCVAGNHDLFVTITRDKMEELCRPLVKKTLDIVDKAIEDAAKKGLDGKKDIDDVILIGGSTRMRLVGKMVKEYFGGKDLCVSINPDEAVAYGAAIQADILCQRGRVSRRSSTLLMPEIEDVTPLTLGIECLEDTVSKVILRNQKIPCTFEETYYTSEDDETRLRFTICQGESDKASKNIQLGEFIFDGIPEAPAGQEKVKVAMTINTMGILVVKAQSLTNGKENSIAITSNQLGMKDEDIDILRKELEKLEF